MHFWEKQIMRSEDSEVGLTLHTWSLWRTAVIWICRTDDIWCMSPRCYWNGRPWFADCLPLDRRVVVLVEAALWARRPQTTLCNWGVLLKSVTVPRTSLTDDLGLKHCRELLVTFGSPYVTSHKHNAAAAAAAAPLTTAKSQRKHKNFILIKFLSSRRVQTAAICIYIVCSRRCVEDTLTFTV